MADKKVSELDAIIGADTASDDLFLIVDSSGSVTKKITREELNNAIERDVLSSIDINGGTIDATPIGGTTPAAGSFTTVGTTGDLTAGANIVVTGTVDGRDVAADGTKLDGVEASADVTDATNVQAAGALMDSELTSEASVKALNQGVATTDDPSFVDATFTGTGAVKMPAGTTAQRPTAAQGQIRFNTTDTTFEGYDGSAWGAIGGDSGETSLILYEYTATAGQTTFSGADDNAATLSYTADNIQVVMNGIVLDPSDYTATNGTSVVLASGAAVNDIVNIYAFKSFTVADTVSASAGGTFSGAVAMANGLTVDDDGAAPLTLDRATSGGTIVDVQKDGSSVGTIAEKDGEITIGSGDVGLRFYAAGDAVIPVTSTNQEVRDNAIDLGGSSYRFNDLYLGGGAYIGGTAAANHLDDYEEGSWTPTITFGGNSAGQSYASRRVGKYTKIGRLVTVTFFVQLTNKGTSTGAMSATGLPFSASTTDTPMFVGSVMFNGVSHASYISPVIDSGQSKIDFYETAESGSRSEVGNTDVANNDEIGATVTYFV